MNTEIRIRRAVVLVDDYVDDSAVGNVRPGDAKNLVPFGGKVFRAKTPGDARARLDHYLQSFGLPPLTEQGGNGKWVRNADGTDAGCYQIMFVADKEAVPDRDGAFLFDLTLWIETVEAKPFVVGDEPVRPQAKPPVLEKCSTCDGSGESPKKDRSGEYLPCGACGGSGLKRSP